MDLKIVFLSFLLTSVLGFMPIIFRLPKKSIPKLRFVENSEEKWLKVPLDHFDDKNQRTINMRYIENAIDFKPKGPVIIHWSSDNTATGDFPLVVTELSEEINGLKIQIDPRFFYKSMPENKTSDDIKYLTTKQIIADLKVLIEDLKKNYTDSKIVFMGESYGGTIGVWMKEQYPELVDAVSASSAPLLAKADFYEFAEEVTKVYDTKEGCVKTITSLFTWYDAQFNTTEGINKLKRDENICDDIDLGKVENKQAFFVMLAADVMAVAIVGNPERIGNYCGKTVVPLTVNLHSDPEDMFWNKEKNCINFDYDTIVKYINGSDGNRAKLYMQCNEYGHFETFSTDKQMFTKSVPIDFHYKMCADLFGTEFTKDAIQKNVDATNEVYGGLTPNVTETYFIQGGIDPYRIVGVTKTLSDDTKTVVIPEMAHCKDLLPAYDNAPALLVETQADLKKTIKEWIGFKSD